VLAQSLPASGDIDDVVLTVAVTDGLNTATDTVTISALAAGTNLAPTITSPGNLQVDEDANPAARPFTLDDDTDSMADLLGSLTYTSSNTTLLPLSSISVYELNSTTAQIKVTPAAGQTGSSTVTLVAEDSEGLTSQTSFSLVVGSGSTGLVRFWNEYDGGDSPVAPAIAGVEFTVSDADGTEVGTFTTGDNGTADLTSLIGGPYSVTGSVDNPGVVSVSDIVSEVELYLGTADEDAAGYDYMAVAGDINGDGSVTVSDIVSVIELYLGTAQTMDIVLVDDSGDAPTVDVTIGAGNVELTAVALGDLDGS
jgi:hypothetical protein